jgi:ABC-type antimicrobial peptide transport system permease subunit
MSYAEEQNLDKQCAILDESVEKGVYLTEAMAKNCNLERLNQTTIEFDAFIPFKDSRKVVTYTSGDATGEFESRIISYGQEKIRLPIRGILRATKQEPYTGSDDVAILMEASQMMELVKQHTSSNLTEGEENWLPSAYFVFVKDYEDLEPVREHLFRLDPNFKVGYKIQQTELMKEAVQNIQNIMLYVSLAILSIVFFLMAIIYVNLVDKRKFEFAVLRANGLTIHELQALVLTEALIQIIKTIIFSALFGLIILFAVNNYVFSSNEAIFDLKALGVIALTSVLSIFLPTIISLYFANKFSPDQIMREQS